MCIRNLKEISHTTKRPINSKLSTLHNSYKNQAILTAISHASLSLSRLILWFNLVLKNGVVWNLRSSHSAGNVCCGTVLCIRNHGTGYRSFSGNGHWSRDFFAGYRCFGMFFHIGVFNCSLVAVNLKVSRPWHATLHSLVISWGRRLFCSEIMDWELPVFNFLLFKFSDIFVVLH